MKQSFKDSPSKKSSSPPKNLSRKTVRFLQVPEFVKTIRRATDLAHRIDWDMLTPEKHHSKVLDLSQMIINDLFEMIGSSIAEGGAAAVATDFFKSFYSSDRKSTTSPEKDQRI